MRPEPGQVPHFSEDPTITRFAPHVVATARQAEPYVWAVDADRSPDYWFPRQCPRAMAWTTPSSTDADRDRIIGTGGGDRVHARAYGWLDAMRTVRLFAYRLPADRFRPFGSPPNAHVATELVGNLFDLHEQAGIQLRVLADLGPFWQAVITSSLGFSGIRPRNARSAS